MKMEKSVKKRLLFFILAFILVCCATGVGTVPVRASGNKVTGAYSSENMFVKGKYIYYIDPIHGDIRRYDTKTGKDKLLRANEGSDWGYTNLTVSGKYIYASFCKDEGTSGDVLGCDIYRISLNGKKAKKIAGHIYYWFAIADSRIYYHEMVGGPDIEDPELGEGDLISIKLNGKDRKVVNGLDIEYSDDAPISVSAYDGEVKFKSGKYTFTLSGDLKKICRGKKVLFQCDEGDWFPYIGLVSAHKGHLLFLHEYISESDGYESVREQLIYMDKNGKNQKVLLDYVPAG